MRLSGHNKLLISLGFLILFLGGCTDPTAANKGITIFGTRPAVSMSVSRLAQDLGLTVVDQNSRQATLRSTGNLVMFYPDPRGHAYVNGKPIGPSGGIFFEQGEMFVPVALEAPIQQSLVRPSTMVRPKTTVPYVYRPQVKTPALAKLDHGRVLIDPGHGGNDPGARSVHGASEKSIVLDVGVKLSRDLRVGGVNTSMTRSSDVFLTLEDRRDMGGKLRSDLFVSVHADSAPRASANGFTIYVCKSATAKSLAAAACIERAMSAAGFTSQGIRRENFRVITNNHVPAVLVELGYLSNAAEASRLGDASWRTAYADAIANGVLQYLRNNP